MPATPATPKGGGNRFGQALNGSTARRRVAGERAGGTETPASARATPAGHRRVAVDLPEDLYEEAKMLAITHRVTVKEILNNALAAEVARLRAEPR